MASITFDTLAYAKRLREGGFTEQQAEAHTQAQKQVLSEVLDTTLATKMDINRLERLVEGDIDRLEKQIAALKWMMGVMLAGVISLVLKSFFIKSYCRVRPISHLAGWGLEMRKL